MRTADGCTFVGSNAVGGYIDIWKLQLRRYLADTFALVMFSIAVGAFVEIFIAGLTLSQTVRVRAAAVPIALLTGRPYGIYRDWLINLFAANSGRIRKLIIDAVANVTFQIPLYSSILAANGATYKQIITAVSSIIVVIILSGPPYGVFLVWCRRLFRADAM